MPGLEAPDQQKICQDIDVDRRRLGINFKVRRQPGIVDRFTLQWTSLWGQCQGNYDRILAVSNVTGH